jgi:hypothetical protein
MKQKSLFYLFLSFTLFVLAACNAAGGAQPTAEEISADNVSVSQCAEATAGSHQLIAAAHGVCFLYTDNFDVFESQDGSGFTLYVDSLLNTEAPVATFAFAPVNGRSLEDILSQYLPDVDFSAVRLQTVNLGGETGTILDNLPGQDLNRRVIAIHNDMVVDIMVARIGAEYGEVGEQAEALISTITDSFQFIDIDPNAALMAGPECPEAIAGTTLFTNAEDGFCLLLPEGYTVDDSLSTDNGGGETAVFIGSMLDADHAHLFITVEDAVDRTLEEITGAHELEIETALPGFDVMWSFGYMLDGIAANQFDQVPGQDLSRQVMMVNGGRLYTLTFTPDDPQANAYADMQILYDTVMDSFSFLR